MKSRSGVLAIVATAILLGMLLSGQHTSDAYVSGTIIVCIALAWVSPLLSTRKIITLPASIEAMIVLSLCLHCLGLITDWYNTTFWWDKVTHLASGITVGALVAVALMIVGMEENKAVYIPRRWVPFFVAIGVVALGVFWEMMEFGLDTTVGTHMQHGLEDTVNDLISDGVAGVLVGIASTFCLRRSSIRECVESFDVSKILARWDQKAKTV